MYQPTLLWLEGTLELIANTGGSIDPASAWVGLYQVGSSVGPSVVFDDLTEATYDGYARIPLEPWTAAFLSGGKPTVQAGEVSFNPSGDSVSNNIGGYFVIDTATLTGGILGYEPLSPTKLMASADDRLTIEMRLVLDQLANYGAAGIQR